MKIILIGNYSLDKQESMERFAQMLQAGFQEEGIESEIWRPKKILAHMFTSTNSGIAKWVGYIDKWILFPIVLRLRQLDKKFNNSDIHFHICDHSNAPYLYHLPDNRTIITCHDVLAIRGALGYADAFCPASGFGKILQKWIFYHLSRAKRVACVSQLTLNQLNELTLTTKHNIKDWRVIHNGFNAKFDVISQRETEALLKKVGLEKGRPFILHVGSGLPRKNRIILVDMVRALGHQWTGCICFAGQPLDESLLNYAESFGLKDRIISVKQPNHATLVALYNACEAFIFPSLSEGFGWPIIEAQACGAPVIASNVAPLPEVSGGAALHANPTEINEFVDAFLSLKDEVTRLNVIQNGYKNCVRFEATRMINAYLNLHDLKKALA